jgi:hypothetical protein
MPNYYEWYGYPKARWDRGLFHGWRRLSCAWDDLFSLLLHFDANPQWPYTNIGPPDAYIRRVDIEPWCAQTNEIGASEAEYDRAVLTLWHSTLGPTLFETTWIEESLEPSRQMVTVANTALRWQVAGQVTGSIAVAPAEAPQRVQGLYWYRAVFNRVLALPAWVLARPGFINANPVASVTLGLVFPPLTLRWDGASVFRRITLGRVNFYDIVANFVFNPDTWNRYWHAENMQMEFMTLPDGTLYQNHTAVSMTA